MSLPALNHYGSGPAGRQVVSSDLIHIGGLKKMHKTVLKKSAVEGLEIQKGAIVIDATLGNGGHSEEILEKLEEGILIGIDLDEEAIEFSRKRLEEKAKNGNNKLILIRDNFSNIKEIIGNLKIEKVDAILADLGWRAEQIENEKYGMSFKKDGPLNMNLSGERSGLTAEKIVNNFSQIELEEIFRKYGQERFARKISRDIERFRRTEKITTTGTLAEIVKKSIGRFCQKSKIHPATRVFQALRIAVNHEMENLEKFLVCCLDILNKRGKLAVISFHSLEDGMTKKFFQANARGCICPKDLPVCVCTGKPKLKIITKKPVTVSEKERKENPRSRSARLRIAEKK